MYYIIWNKGVLMGVDDMVFDFLFNMPEINIGEDQKYQFAGM